MSEAFVFLDASLGCFIDRVTGQIRFTQPVRGLTVRNVANLIGAFAEHPAALARLNCSLEFERANLKISPIPK